MPHSHKHLHSWFFMDAERDESKEAIAVKLSAIIPPGLIFANADGSVKPGLLAKFSQDELIVLKGQTFKVVYLNEKAVTLEPVGIPVLQGGTDD